MIAANLQMELEREADRLIEAVLPGKTLRKLGDGRARGERGPPRSFFW
jgi:hypothetical protein